MELNNIKNQQLKLLDDQPAAEDKLGPHNRIAMAIFRLINQNEGGKTISVEGAWGAGKSTVVKILTNEIKKDTNKKLIVYDAWSHSGDPLRRSFLNTLIDELQSVQWLKEPDEAFKKEHHIFERLHLEKTDDSEKDGVWLLIKKCLAGTRKTTKKTTTPLLTSDGEKLVILLGLLPIGVLVFANFLRLYVFDKYLEFSGELGLDYFFTNYSIWVHIAFFASFLLAFGPFIYLLIKRVKGNAKNLLLLMFNKTTIDETLTTFESSDPTTIEFQDVFAAAMSMSLLERDRRLIIVLDNLDRLRSDEAESVWSLLRSFIDPNTYNIDVHNWIKQLWVVVPIAEIEFSENSKNSSAQLKSTEKPEVTKTEQFIDKVVQVRFKVPPPVLSNWEEYLYSKLDDAFGLSVNVADKKIIYRLYDHYQRTIGNNKNPITPRALLLFVNDLISLSLLWGNKFPTTVLAAYCLDTKEKDILDSLRTGYIPSQFTQQVFGADIKSNFASIFFNIDETSKALELLYIPTIENNLKNDRLDDLINMFQDESHAIKYFLSGTIKWFLEWNIQDNNGLFNVATIAFELTQLSENKYEQLIGVEDTKLIHQRLKMKIGKVNVFTALNKRVVAGIEAFIKLGNESEATAAILAGAHESSYLYINNDNSLRKTSSEISQWLNEFEEIINMLDVDAVENFTIFLPLDSSSWLAYCERFIKDRLACWDKFRPMESAEQIAARLSESIGKIGVSEGDFLSINWLVRAGKTKVLSPVFSALEQRLSFQQNSVPEPTSTELKLILEFYLQQVTIAEIKESAKRIQSRGYFYSYFENFVDDPEFMARLFCLILLTDIKLTAAPSGSAMERGREYVKEILSSSDILDEEELLEINKVIEDYKLEGLFIEFARSNFDKRENFKNLASKYNQEKIFDQISGSNLGDDFYHVVSRLLDNNDQTRARVADYLIENKGLLDQMTKEKMSTQNAYLYVSILLSPNKKTQEFISKLEKFLSGFNKDIWLQHLNQTNSTLRILMLLRSRNSQQKFGSGLSEALVEYVSKFDQMNLKNLNVTWFKNTISFLDSEHLKVLHNKLMQQIESATKPFSKTFWQCFIEEVVTSLVDTKFKKLPTFLMKLVEIWDFNGLDKLSERLQKDKVYLNPNSKGAKELRTALNKKIKSNGLGSSELTVVNRIKRLIKIKGKR